MKPKTPKTEVVDLDDQPELNVNGKRLRPDNIEVVVDVDKDPTKRPRLI